MLKDYSTDDSATAGWHLAGRIIRAGDGTRPGDVNQALMELGATYCSPSGTGLDERDPLRSFYKSTRIGAAIGYQLNLANDDGALFMNGRDWFCHSKETEKEEKDSTLHRDLVTAFKAPDTMEEFISLSLKERSKNNVQCKLCDSNGIEKTLQYIYNEIQQSSSNGMKKTKPMSTIREVAAMGHSALPMAPPKKSKREEVLAVAALRHVSMDGDATVDRWFMVKRPTSGLLSGQWEFPSVCVWTSDDGKSTTAKKKAKSQAHSPLIGKNGEVIVPLIPPSKRKMALDALLDKNEGSSTIRDMARYQIGSKPIEHVFSHVRHTMWIEYGELDKSKKWSGDIMILDGREARWLSDEDMKSVGITSGVKKILAHVKKLNKL